MVIKDGKIKDDNIFICSVYRSPTEACLLVILNDKIIIKPISSIRKDWDAEFKRMTKNNDDILLDDKSLMKQTSWDNEEWTW